MNTEEYENVRQELLDFCEKHNLHINRHSDKRWDNVFVMHEDKIIYCSSPRYYDYPNYTEALCIKEIACMFAWCKAFVKEGKTLTHYVPRDWKLT
jgi:hypothetical protein